MKLLTILTLCAFSLAGQAYINSTANTPSSSSVISISTPAFSVTTGNFIAVCVGRNLSVTGSTTVTDTAGNSYSQIGSQTRGDSYGISLHAAKNISGHASNVVTATYSANSDYGSIIAAQYSGVHATAAHDVFVGGNNSDTSVTTPSFTTSFADELLITCAPMGSGTTNTPSVNYTLRATDGILEMSLADRITSSILTGSTMTWSFSASTIAAVVLGSWQAAPASARRRAVVVQ